MDLAWAVWLLRYRLRPRSPSFTTPLALRNTFPGLMSRCITRCACMCETAVQSWVKMLHTCPSARNAPAASLSLTKPPRSPQSQNSRVMTSSLFSMNESVYLMMFGWLNDCSSLTSFTQSARCFVSMIS